MGANIKKFFSSLLGLLTTTDFLLSCERPEYHISNVKKASFDWCKTHNGDCFLYQTYIILVIKKHNIFVLQRQNPCSNNLSELMFVSDLTSLSLLVLLLVVVE